MTGSGDNSSAPTRSELDPDSPLTELRGRVMDAIRALPSYFASSTNIEGIQATDLFALNTVLGTTIEVQVIATLNAMRDVWDPDDRWQTHSFERQAQTFPDVRLVSRDGDTLHIALGIELKGWYLLAKEGEPSLRLTVNPQACAEHDLVAVVPWHLSNVLSGVPVALAPWVESARFAAEYRNYWWQEVRDARTDSAITEPAAEIGPYPSKADEVSDKPVSDRGGNFGRLARTGLMDDFLEAARKAPIAGIAAEHWIRFFRTYSESKDYAEISARLEREYRRMVKAATEEEAQHALDLLRELGAMFWSNDR